MFLEQAEEVSDLASLDCVPFAQNTFPKMPTWPPILRTHLTPRFFLDPVFHGRPSPDPPKHSLPFQKCSPDIRCSCAEGRELSCVLSVDPQCGTRRPPPSKSCLRISSTRVLWRVGPWACTCLLYTSDAADEERLV